MFAIEPRETTDLNLMEGTAGSFAVTATGAQPLRYQWKKGDNAIPGATNSSYSIPNAQLVNEGFYSVTVSNNSGAVFSRSARLNVIQEVVPPEQITLYGLTGIYDGLPHVVTASSPDLVAADALRQVIDDAAAAVVTDESGREQPMTAVYAVTPLRAAIAAYGDGRDMSIRQVLDDLRPQTVVTIIDQWSASADIDLPEDADRLGFS